jgi:hypothetical protein
VKTVIGERFQATTTSMGFIVAMWLLHCNNETTDRMESHRQPA